MSEVVDFKKELIEELKDKGIDLAEQLAKGAVEAVLDAAVKYAAASENKIDDILLALIPVIKPVIIEWVDKLDGEVG